MSRIGYITCATAAIIVATMFNYASLSSPPDGSRTYSDGYHGDGSYSGGGGYSGGHK